MARGMWVRHKATGTEGRIESVVWSGGVQYARVRFGAGRDAPVLDLPFDALTEV